MQKHDITMTVKLPIKVIKKARWYVASCPVLDVFSQGDTEKKDTSTFLWRCYPIKGAQTIAAHKSNSLESSGTCRSGHEFYLSVHHMINPDDKEIPCISVNCLFKRLPLGLLALRRKSN